MDNKRDPVTGRWAYGNTAPQMAERKAAQAIYKTIRDLCTPEFMREQLLSLLSQGGQVQRQTLAMMLDRIAPEVKQLAISTDGNTQVWNLTSLTEDELASLQGLALKTIGSAPIDAQFTPLPTEAD